MLCSKKTVASGFAVLFLSCGAAAAADPFENLRYAFSGGTPNLDFRLRYENVDQNNALRNANAFTARTRLGYTTGKWNLFDIAAEYEGIADLSEDAYNSTTNGQAGRSTVGDPTGDELNQAFIRYAGLPGTVLKLGRQRIIYDNARFIGNVGWRQNEQTYDAFSLVNTTLPKTTFNYAYIGAIKGTNFAFVDASGHLLNLKYALMDELALTGYGYWLDFKLDPAAPPALSARRDSRTLGLRAAGTVALAYPIIYAAEYARQSQYKDSPSTVSAYYELAELGSKFGPVSPTLGYEKLSGNGTYGMQTPLATFHAFDGWADQFLITPNTGLVKTYLKLTGVACDVTLTGFYHRFTAASGGAHYGNEWDASASYPVNDNLSVTLKYADYNASSFSVDTKKTWALVEYKF